MTIWEKSLQQLKLKMRRPWDVIPPGESGTVTIEATVHPGDERSLEMIVKTDGEAEGTLPFRLTVVGKAPIPHVAWHSPVVQFGEIEGEARSASITINTRERLGSDPWIRDASTGVDGLSISGGFVEDRASGVGIVYRTYHYELTFDEPPPPGKVAGRVSFRNGYGEPVMMQEIPILGVVRPPVSAVPPALFASLEPDTEPTTLLISLARTSLGGPFRARAEEVGEGIVVDEVGEDRGQPTFAVRAVDAGQERRGRLIFWTDVEGAERIEVPYVFRVRSEGANRLDAPG
jgi:hypothetical protein